MAKTPMSEKERLDLAAQLDRDLDDFIDNLPKREPQEPVPFDRWEEELTNHPFFMKEVPEDGELHPLYAGLQKLKYDPEENEPEELALAYKDDGNFNFKHKKYRMAIISYTEGIKAKSGNSDLDATLHNNRSAAHFFLKNYRSSLLDAEKALKLKPGYDKALLRAANCCYKTEKFDKTIHFCDQILEKNKNHKEALELRKKSINESKIKERNHRKKEAQEKKAQRDKDNLLNEIAQRGVRIQGRLEPQLPEFINTKVFLQGSNLCWPVVFFYPEYKIMDFIQEFDETTIFLDQLTQVFANYPEWDKNKSYSPHNVNVYFEDINQRNRKIDVNNTLLKVLKLEGHVIKDGTPRFVILVAGSGAEKEFLDQV